MSTFVLVHGAWHNAWCWHKITPLLEACGHTVIASDLPGHGNRSANVKASTLDDYVGAISDCVRVQASAVILVGHSMSGIVISSVAEHLPDHVGRLVYLSGFLLDDGQSMLEVVREDKEGLVYPNLIYSRDRKLASVRDAMIIPAFYHLCPEKLALEAKNHIVDQSLAPIASPIHVTPDQWGKVPRAYIECTEDRAVSLPIQRQMYQRVGITELVSMNSDHSPFLSSPESLAKTLDELSRSKVHND